MSIFRSVREDIDVVIEEMAASGELPPGCGTAAVAVEAPRDPAHGDVTTNAPLVLAKSARRKPRDIAEAIATRLAALDHVATAEVAGPGFVNLRLADFVWHEELRTVLKSGVRYGDCAVGGGQAVNVEFVSVNPTGPLHVGHGRGAVYGDALATLLARAGFAVTREYYINDAGAQIDSLVRSMALRVFEATGADLAGQDWEGLYPGDYLKPAAALLAQKFAKSAVQDLASIDAFRLASVAAMMDLIRDDLAALGVRIDVFSSERELHRTGAVDAAIDGLADRGLVYLGTLEPPKGKEPEDWEPREQTLFRSTQFGDDVDRPLKKSDGSWTYFASDIAYHSDKIERGFAEMIDVWGADHGGYVKRMKAAVEALSKGRARLDIKLCQMVKLSRGGKPVKMSKRSGDFVTLREVVDEVGRDVVRFIMLTRKNDAPLEFDFDKVVEQTQDNPVFYLQYAHARGRSVFRKAAAEMPDADLSSAALAGADIGRLVHPGEIAVIKRIAEWPGVVEAAALAHEPHRIAYYLHDVAASFQSHWTLGNRERSLRFLVPEDRALSFARLALIQGVLTVIASGLEILGVEPVDEMR